MKPKNKPGRGPEQQVILALDAIDVRKKARHQKRGNQQREGNEALMYQAQSILRPPTDGRALTIMAQKFLRVVSCRHAPVSHTQRQLCGDAESRAQTQNKV